MFLCRLQWFLLAFSIFRISSVKFFIGDCSYGFCHQGCKQVKNDIMQCYCFRGYALKPDGRGCDNAPDDNMYSGDGDIESSGENKDCDDDTGDCGDNKTLLMSGDDGEKETLIQNLTKEIHKLWFGKTNLSKVTKKLLPHHSALITMVPSVFSTTVFSTEIDKYSAEVYYSAALNNLGSPSQTTFFVATRVSKELTPVTSLTPTPISVVAERTNSFSSSTILLDLYVAKSNHVSISSTSYNVFSPARMSTEIISSLTFMSRSNQSKASAISLKFNSSIADKTLQLNEGPSLLTTLDLSNKIAIVITTTMATDRLEIRATKLQMTSENMASLDSTKLFYNKTKFYTSNTKSISLPVQNNRLSPKSSFKPDNQVKSSIRKLATANKQKQTTSLPSGLLSFENQQSILVRKSLNHSIRMVQQTSSLRHIKPTKRIETIFSSHMPHKILVGRGSSCVLKLSTLLTSFIIVNVIMTVL